MPDDDETYEYPADEQRDFLYDNLGFGESAQDQTAHDLFWSVYYDNDLSIPGREAVLQELNDYLWDEYGIDFEAVWDWEDFREWYDSA